MSTVDIGKRMQMRRHDQGVSVVDIAASTGLSKATIHRYENGEIRNIKLPVIESIAEILNCNPLWLIGKSEIVECERQSNDLLVELEKLTERVKHTKGVMFNGKNITEEQRSMLIAALQLAINVLK